MQITLQKLWFTAYANTYGSTNTLQDEDNHNKSKDFINNVNDETVLTFNVSYDLNEQGVVHYILHKYYCSYNWYYTFFRQTEMDNYISSNL